MSDPEAVEERGEAHRTYRFAIIPEWVLYHASLTGADVKVYCILDRFASDSTRDCWPSIATIAERDGRSERRVADSLKALEAVGAIRITRRRTSSIYTLAGNGPLREAMTESSDLAQTESSELGTTISSEHAQTKSSDKRESLNESHRTRPLPPEVARKPNVVFDALVAACGWDYGEMTDRQRRACGVAASELRKVGASPDDVLHRAQVYTRRHPGAALTPSALANQWAALNLDARQPNADDKSMAAIRRLAERDNPNIVNAESREISR